MIGWPRVKVLVGCWHDFVEAQALRRLEARELLQLHGERVYHHLLQKVPG
jgi:hypothetical protein